MATITVDTWEEPEHFMFRLTIVDEDEVVLFERGAVPKADATQDDVEAIAYTRARDFIGSTTPCVRRTLWDGDRPPVSAELAWSDAAQGGRAAIKLA
jgi:hypothetical protein